MKKLLCICIGILIVGCVAHQTIPKLKEKVTKKPDAPELFAEKKNHTVMISPDASHVAVSLLPGVHHFVLCRIPIKHMDSVLYIKIKEDKLINIDRYLINADLDAQNPGIETKEGVKVYNHPEYRYNKKDETIDILMDLPLLYLLNEKITFDFHILAYNSDTRLVKELKKSLTFYWKPQKRKSTDDKPGLDYIDILVEKENTIANLENIQKQIISEMTYANMDRFDQTYRKSIERFVTQ
ncbi:MAG: hypothetical protein OMM_05017 [Candidatus Magnetoglobus multicellularis str. Araruama]|uniref:Lipoprotein n=1 Tax=Candidatus Magnetoglobus multicellularis str. Araruama TaxID=890399 RepID=A0A1V1NYN8_9BACT|nr:MAG: hypothetical protein OMM_05017 [Candidatus Magnetoglobus multicellularis str. Araruama]